MKNNEFKDTLIKGFAEYNYNISGEQINKLVNFNQMVMDVNKHTNLTAIENGAESAKKHFLDSLNPAAISCISSAKKIIDVGSGAGFPGIPLSILKEQADFTLLDTRKKRCEFIESAVSELGLKNVTVLWGRAEELGKDKMHREQYDIACARALAAAPILLEYLSPFLKIGGHVLLYKGKEAENEIAQSQNAADILGIDKFAVIPYKITDDVSSYNMLYAEKIFPTPDKYPRKPGIALKRPL